MSKSHKESQFQLEGRFLGYVFKDGYKIKRLELVTPDAEFSIKVTKESRLSLERSLLPGDLIRVVGMQKRDSKTGAVKMKAISVSLASGEAIEVPSAAQTKPGKMSVLYCQKSSCMKRGGKAACQALSQALSDRTLSDKVAVKGTGCMKACSKGPNFVFMPGKVRYSKVSAKDMSTLVDEHFPRSLDVQEPLLPTERLPIEAVAGR
ncbi:(2Fe-2S) ferredoxin domain-containing protein [Myxacorys almedinensis]|uniref:(2Fe-2S) ferredoxin domain-containing protein n=1 Tax=Myxacorys almedinensis A TaxID=2690445 RepID=A0A8J7Z1I4_9CYAN|nr:(2Fe-2S) ferredoxin domain-containing protein [Myxacorys almedinensis]NDJ18612.1 (2Fe-2S) ferredoxin domain-containing protein [Myxacorys almedinensis A]